MLGNGVRLAPRSDRRSQRQVAPKNHKSAFTAFSANERWGWLHTVTLDAVFEQRLHRSSMIGEDFEKNCSIWAVSRRSVAVSYLQWQNLAKDE